jgi:dihydroorotase
MTEHSPSHTQSRKLQIIRPDDWHIHLRDGDYLPACVSDASRYFGRVIVMPNLVPPVTDAQIAAEYRQRILKCLKQPAESQWQEDSFQPLMTLYITPDTNAQTVTDASESGIVHAFKLYPAGATTNSDAGVDQIESLYPLFAAMEANGMVLSIHGEVTDPSTDIFDREALFIEQQLTPICERFPALKIVLEHITTSQAVDFVKEASQNIAATITAHHLLFNRNDLLSGSIKPIYYCLPVLKRNTHQQALINAATSGSPKFFLGTDSAPHPKTAKENACGCAAGCYTAHAAIELYAEAFDQAGALDQLQGFSSFYGADFYDLPRNKDTITLVQKSWDVQETQLFGSDQLIPIRAGEKIHWQVESSTESTLEKSS